MLHVAIATRTFRRYSTYRGATLAGIFTNSVFGVIYSYAYLALWGGGTTDDLAERIRTGDVAIDLYRPVGLVGWYLAGDLGRAAYHLLTRGLAPTLVGLALFDIRLPASPAAAVGFLASLVLAVTVSFAIRFLVASTAFWLLDANGARVLSGAAAIFFSGMMLPLVLFPGWLGTVARALPWSAYVQVPIDVWLGHHTGAGLLGALAFQALWIAVLLGCCHLVLRAATRKVVVQGG